MKKDLLKHLYELMLEGIYAENIQGTCSVQIHSASSNDVKYFKYYNRSLTLEDYSDVSPDASVKINEETLVKIFRNLESFDLRDNEILSQVVVDGNIDLILFLFGAIKRTPKEVVTKLQETISFCKGFKENINKVERINNPTKEEFFELMNQCVPFLVTGLLDNWEFLSLSLEEIKQKYGKVKLRPKSSGDKVIYETLNDFIDQMEKSSNQVYTEGCDLPLVMRSKFQLPYLDWKHVNSPLLWMGTKTGNTPCTGLHRDCHYGLLTNLFGRKRIVLYSPEQSENLYPVGAFNMFQSCAIWNVDQVNTNEFPLFKNAKSIEVTVGPSESLIIPAFWFHCVYALDNVFSVSHGIHWKAWEAKDSKMVLSET